MASSNTAALGETFDLLTHPYRRYVLYYLQTHSEGMSIETLTAMLANEVDGSSETTEKDPLTRIEIALRHTHLPKLADADLITIAQDKQSVELDTIDGHSQFIDQAARIDGYTLPIAGD